MVVFSFNLQSSGEEHGIWKMTFFTPAPVTMVLREATQAGYSAMTTSNRVVVRSPYNTAETYSEDVSVHSPSLYTSIVNCTTNMSYTLGCWSSYGGFEGHCLLQDLSWSKCGEHGCCLSHRWGSKLIDCKVSCHIISFALLPLSKWQSKSLNSFMQTYNSNQFIWM